MVSILLLSKRKPRNLKKMHHYQIYRKKDEELLYDSRIRTSFEGFPTEQGALIAAKAKLSYYGLLDNEYDIKIL